VLWSVPIVLFFSWTTLTSKSPMHGQPAYTPAVTWHRWIETTGEYLALAFYRTQATGRWAIAIYAAAIGAALVSVEGYHLQVC